MNNVRIFKAAYYMNDGVYFTDVCKELVSKTFALGSTFYKTCDVNEFDDCRSYFFGIIEISK